MTMDTSWGKSSHSKESNCLEARWQKSSYSAYNGSCLEARRWKKSSYSSYANGCLAARWAASSHCQTSGPCQTSECAQVRQLDGVVQVRDTKDLTGPVLSFRPEVWDRFLAPLR